MLAEQEIERVWIRALGSVEVAEEALNNPKVETTARAYRDLGTRLQVAFEDLASATYCLSEWAEPDDEQADVEMWDVEGLRRTHGRSGDRDDVALPSSRKRPLLSLGLARAIRELRTVDAAQLGVEAGVPGWQMQALEEGRFSPEWGCCCG